MRKTQLGQKQRESGKERERDSVDKLICVSVDNHQDSDGSSSLHAIEQSKKNHPKIFQELQD
jgi:hypothetical protein